MCRRNLKLPGSQRLDLKGVGFYPGSSSVSGGMAVDECANVWPGCRPTGA